MVGYGNDNGADCTLAGETDAGSIIGDTAPGATSGSAIAGLVAGCVLVVGMMVGVFTVASAKTGQATNTMIGPGTETDTDSSIPPGDLDWDTDEVTLRKIGVSSPGNVEAL